MKKDRHLPAGMYLKHGSYWLVRRNKWHRLGPDLAKALELYAQHLRAGAGTLPGLLDRWLLNVDGACVQQPDGKCSDVPKVGG